MLKKIMVGVCLIIILSTVFAWSIGDTVTQTQINNINTTDKNNMIDGNMVWISLPNENKFVDINVVNDKVIFTALTTTLERNGVNYTVVEKYLDFWLGFSTINNCLIAVGDYNCFNYEIPKMVISNLNAKLLNEKMKVMRFKTKINLVDSKTLLQKIINAFNLIKNNT